ncbi:hypothetical protein F53441_5417 [Fusarium austroafricanum]|uniref:Uncharacterized protein n=1 Tax=Fusarium austroafricanum TaxID=2364996 RepID=A0A8H4KM51_9HYPO|nr:hypothetical protein F53441_5417 [Fusarium austroafricanum]
MPSFQRTVSLRKQIQDILDTKNSKKAARGTPGSPCSKKTVSAKKKVRIVLPGSHPHHSVVIYPGGEEAPLSPFINEWEEYNKDRIVVATGTSNIATDEFDTRFPHFNRAWMGFLTDTEARELLKLNADVHDYDD